MYGAFFFFADVRVYVSYAYAVQSFLYGGINVWACVKLNFTLPMVPRLV